MYCMWPFNQLIEFLQIHFNVVSIQACKYIKDWQPCILDVLLKQNIALKHQNVKLLQLINASNLWMWNLPRIGQKQSWQRSIRLDYSRSATNMGSVFEGKAKWPWCSDKVGKCFYGTNVSMGDMEVWCFYTTMEILNLWRSNRGQSTATGSSTCSVVNLKAKNKKDAGSV